MPKEARMELVLREFKSRRNRVTLIETAAGPVIKKERRSQQPALREICRYYRDDTLHALAF